LVGLAFFLKHRPRELDTVPPSYRTISWIKSAIPFGLSAAMTLVNGQTDVIVLGMYRDDAEIGVYRVAVQMATMVIFGLQVVNLIQGPHIAHLYALKDMKRLQTLVTRSSQGILLLTIPIVLLVVLFGRPIIRIAFGAEYEGAYVPLVILCVGQLVNASMGSVGSLLNMTGHERDTTRSIFVGACVNILLNFALTPVWGMRGAAIATASTLIVWNMIMWRLVYRRTGIQASALVRRRQ
jgi:O-antigen/teichoic acid export membrane protein